MPPFPFDRSAVRPRSLVGCTVACLCVFMGLAGRDVHAQVVLAPADPTPTVTLGGYVEAYGSWNFARPANGINALRGFDDRHDSLTLANVALDAAWQQGDAVGKLTLQNGSTPASYFAAEPSRAGSPGVAASGPDLWRFVQQAYAGYKVPVGHGLLLTAGVFLSPIGPENIAVKENWNWSRSNLFFGLPYYHTGLRAAYDLSPTWTATLGLVNGWNSIVDNNTGKSVLAQLSFKRQDGSLTGTFLYFGGVERASGAPEGQPWRHLLDAYGTWDPVPSLTLGLHGDTGWEPNAFGTSSWLAGAAYVRVRVLAWAWLAVRGDAFRETVARNDLGSASALFWPTDWVSSGTATLDLRPVDHFSLRIEYRHDAAASPVFFRGTVTGDGSVQAPFLANSSSQDTATVGVTSWF
jgi:hypothetical protein